MITAPTTLGAIVAFLSIFGISLWWASRPPAGHGHTHKPQTEITPHGHTS